MSDFQNTALNTSKFTLSTYLKWGAILLIVILAVCGILLTRSSEMPAGFLAKWKNAIESADLKSYDALWVKKAQNQHNSGYQQITQLFEEKIKIEVNIANAVNRTRKDPQHPSHLRIEEIPVLLHTVGEPLIQSKTLTVAKTGLIRQRWKLVSEEVISEEFGSDLSAFEANTQESPVDTISQSNSPVAPFVLEWKKALESRNIKKYDSLWDKSARKKRLDNYRLARLHMDQELDVNLIQAKYTPVAHSKTRHVVDNISVTVSSSGAFIETHPRTLTIEKKGFFFRRWKLINDEVGKDSITDQPISQQDQLDIDVVPEESATGTYNGDAPIDTQFKVRQILGKWQKAWEEEDLDTYMSIYAERALITRVTVRDGKETPSYLRKKELRQKMKQLNRYYADIQIKISKLEIKGDRAVADATFLQEFKGTPASGTRPAYKDIGTKKLTLMIDPADGYWKIYAETWSLYVEVPEYPKN
jgi:ketosteroid isomerase-like protein